MSLAGSSGVDSFGISADKTGPGVGGAEDGAGSRGSSVLKIFHASGTTFRETVFHLPGPCDLSRSLWHWHVYGRKGVYVHLIWENTRHE